MVWTVRSPAVALFKAAKRDMAGDLSRIGMVGAVPGWPPPPIQTIRELAIGRRAIGREAIR
ncbi:hypothetical protein GCM10007856_55290 [Azospirillum oryzae]|nr:hypothetical protein GCM10007856_55290 [Azospirillum oryzae]